METSGAAGLSGDDEDTEPSFSKLQLVDVVREKLKARDKDTNRAYVLVVTWFSTTQQFNLETGGGGYRKRWTGTQSFESQELPRRI